ncbi:hypothetical protein LCGC14_2007260 [marine sediment metagenome]|uniref:Uncharacterized protein n=1 Tax=marine sediment metagenome TaxID=412755 RepID=A0A0F9HER7_9ZZZZ
MVIKKKETKKTPVLPSIEDIINRGGATTIESKVSEQTLESEIRFTLRIPAKLIKKVDEARSSRVGNVSRNQWILEAISKVVK